LNVIGKHSDVPKEVESNLIENEEANVVGTRAWQHWEEERMVCGQHRPPAMTQAQ